MLFIVGMLQNYASSFIDISTAKWLIYEQNLTLETIVTVYDEHHLDEVNYCFDILSLRATYFIYHCSTS